MKRYTHLFWGFVLVMIGLFIGCHENDRGITQTGSGAGNLGMNVQISDCGGFDIEVLGNPCSRGNTGHTPGICYSRDTFNSFRESRCQI